MDFKKSMLKVYGKIPTSISNHIFTLYSKGMKLISSILVSKMDRDIKKIKDIKEAIDFAFSYKYLTLSIRTGQVRSEITKLLEIIKDKNPKIILEIGTASGGTLFLFTNIANPEATIISIDLPGGAFGGGYREWKIPIYQSFAKNKQKIRLVRANSHYLKTFEHVKKILDGRMLDFLFIDGDHTYEGVKKDFNTYSRLVKKGGIIALHDIVDKAYVLGCYVFKFWNEIKKEYKHQELIGDISQNWAGIGVVYL